MKQNARSFFLGVLVTLLVLSVGGAAVAATVTKEATLTYRDITIALDGKEIVPKDAEGNAVEPFIIDGTTYLPVRAVATALNLGVAWDEATSTVILTSQNPGITDQDLLNALILHGMV